MKCARWLTTEPFEKCVGNFCTSSFRWMLIVCLIVLALIQVIKFKKVFRFWVFNHNLNFEFQMHVSNLRMLIYFAPFVLVLTFLMTTWLLLLNWNSNWKKRRSIQFWIPFPMPRNQTRMISHVNQMTRDSRSNVILITVKYNVPYNSYLDSNLQKSPKALVNLIKFQNLLKRTSKVYSILMNFKNW